MKNTPAGIYWFTGLSGSGKTTLSVAVAEKLKARGYPCLILDGDLLRQGLCADLGFSHDHKVENIRRAGEVARLAAVQGCVCLCAFITPYEEMRTRLRQRLGSMYHEIFLACSIATCIERDPKQNYSKVRLGEIKGYTGIDAVYEPPSHPDLLVATDRLAIPECVQMITEFVLKTTPTSTRK